MQPMALGFLAFAAIKTTKLVKTNLSKLIVLVFGLLTFIFFKSPWIFPIVMLLGSLSGLLIKKENEEQIQYEHELINKQEAIDRALNNSEDAIIGKMKADAIASKRHFNTLEFEVELKSLFDKV